MSFKFVSTVPLLAAALVAAETDAAKRLDAAADAFREVMDVAERAIPQRLLDKSECVVVVPGLKKGAFIIGAKYGRGFASCRKKGAGWGAPGGVRVEGGSFGFQIGGSETDVIMLIMNERGAKRLLTSKFTVGGDASAAAGPVGRTATAETDAMMTAEILTWSRARGLFAGVSLQGATLRSDQDSNKELYGQRLLNKDIVLTDRAAPAPAKSLLELLNKFSSRRSN
jgi:lipid-binding SYLF domain-containing protein